MPRYQRTRLGVKAAIFRRGRLLLLHRRNDLALVPGVWDMPGGGVEVGETLEEALRREVREETGFTVRVGRPIHVWINRTRMTSGEKLTSTIFCYACTTSSNKRPEMDPQEHTEFAWVRRKELKDHPVHPNHLTAIQRVFVVS